MPMPEGSNALFAYENTLMVEEWRDILLDQDVRVHQHEAVREIPPEFLNSPAVLGAAPVIPCIGLARELLKECIEVNNLAACVIDDAHPVHSAEGDAVRVVEHRNQASGRVLPLTQDGRSGQIRGVVVHRADILFHYCFF